jgi:hypothetical protein
MDNILDYDSGDCADCFLLVTGVSQLYKTVIW